MDEFKQVNRFDLKLSDTSFSTVSDLLTRTTTEYFKNEPVAQTVEFSSTLEAFIRKIVREELEQFAQSSPNGVDNPAPADITTLRRNAGQ